MHKLPQLAAGKSLLVSDSAENRSHLYTLIAQLAIANRVRVLVMGNRYDGFTIARHIRRHTVAVTAALERISIARVFTCYETASLLSSVSAETAPTFILNLLTTFYDDSIPISDAFRVMQTCIEQFQRIGQQAPVIISASPPSSEQLGRAGLFAILRNATDQHIDAAIKQQAQQLTLL